MMSRTKNMSATDVDLSVLQPSGPEELTPIYTATVRGVGLRWRNNMKKVKMKLRFTAECYDEMVMNEEEFSKQKDHYERIKNDSTGLRDALLFISVSDDPRIVDYDVKMEVEDM